MCHRYGGPELDAAVEAAFLKLTRIRSSHSHLLADSQIAKVAEAAICDELLGMPHSKFPRLRIANTRTTMIMQLPPFDDAPVEHITVVRKEAQDSRKISKRSSSTSKQMHAEPLSPELTSQINELWSDEVKPRVLAIQKALEDSSIGGAIKTAVKTYLEHYQQG